MSAERPDPFRDLDWDPARARAFADRTVDIWEELLRRLSELPVTRGPDRQEVRRAVAIDVPEEPMGGAGTVPGAAADLLAAGLNMNVGGWGLSPSASEIELHLTRWFAGRFGLPETAGGLIVSGGAMANFVGLKAARDHRAGWDVRALGVTGGPPLTMYLSEEAHVVSVRAADMLGLGSEAVRRIPVDEGFRVRVDLLRTAIRRDREAGVQPFAVVASAGMVATGAIDPLGEIADLCAEEGLWYHVDAAYGGPAVLADDLRPLFAGIERADSIAFDPHKWLYTPHSGGCVLVRDFSVLRGSFDAPASYTRQDKARTGRGVDLGALGPQFSRGFWARRSGSRSSRMDVAPTRSGSRTTRRSPGTSARASRSARSSSSPAPSVCRSAASGSCRPASPRARGARSTSTC